MSSEPQLFRVNPESQKSERIEEVDFARLGLQERKDIQEWIAANPSILGEDLLIITKEFSSFEGTDERLDLLAVDADGKLVVIELKRDDTGANVHWQAIKYASYLHHTKQEDIIRILAAYEKGSEEDAKQMLQDHLDNDDLDILNHDQRIILASHRFAQEVTSAALWLNQKTPGEDLITCVQLTPYRDAKTDSLYIQSNTIIPVPGAEDLIIQIRTTEKEDGVSSSGVTRRSTARNYRNDDVTSFLKKVRDLALNGLPDEIKPERKSRWANRLSDNRRYYHLWHSEQPWGNWSLFYEVEMKVADPSKGTASCSYAHVAIRYSFDRQGKIGGLSIDESNSLKSFLDNLDIHEDQKPHHRDTWGRVMVDFDGSTLDDDFAKSLANTLRCFIEVATPAIIDFLDERNEEA